MSRGLILSANESPVRFATSALSPTNPRTQGRMEAFEPYAQQPKRGMAGACLCVSVPAAIRP